MPREEPVFSGEPEPALEVAYSPRMSMVGVGPQPPPQDQGGDDIFGITPARFGELLTHNDPAEAAAEAFELWMDYIEQQANPDMVYKVIDAMIAMPADNLLRLLQQAKPNSLAWQSLFGKMEQNPRWTSSFAEALKAVWQANQAEEVSDNGHESNSDRVAQ